MKNIFTFQVESSIGAFFLIVFTAFLIGIFFSIFKNFNTETDLLTLNEVKIKTIPAAQRELMDEWAASHDISVIEIGGYRAMQRAYPDQPWLK